MKSFSIASVFALAVFGFLEVTAQEGVGPLQIRELLSWNETGLTDRYGQHSDWIELINRSDQAIDLTSYAISDRPDDPMKWRFPFGRLKSGGRLIVFASGSSERTVPGEFHTNFKLAASGEFLLLSGPDEVVYDFVRVLPTTLADVSQGRPDQDSTQWRFFMHPTPGRPNVEMGFESIAGPVSFSVEAGYHAKPLTLEITGHSGEEFRYTLNGDEPSEASELYVCPLEISDRSLEPNGISMIQGTSIANQHTDGWFPPDGSIPKAYSLRVRAFKVGAIPGPIATRTYFVGLDPATRWQLPVVALTTPPEGLFDHETGIYMLGKVFENYRASHPDEPLTGHTPANYTQRGPEWARPGHFEFFEKTGHLGIRQNVRMDIKGQSSRSFRQKSFGLRPVGGNQPQGTFDYPFFHDLQRRGLGGVIDQYQSLLLRNAGNDFDYGSMRDALCHELIAPLGIDVMKPRPVVVFLNGEFWGLYQLRDPGDSDAIATHHGVPRESVVIAESDARIKEGDPNGLSTYLDLRQLLNHGNLADPEVYGKMAALMDIENFMNYQLGEIYIGNADWPHNNVRYWRAINLPPIPSFGRPGFDSRWRWLLFDTDLAYSHPWSGGINDPTLSAALSPTGRPGLNAPWSTALLRGLLQNPGFQVDFINTMAGYLNSVFKEDHAGALVNEMKNAMDPVMHDHIRRWRTNKNQYSDWLRQVRIIDGFSRQRPFLLRQHFVREFGLSGTANLTVEVIPPRGGVVRVHRLKLDASTPGIDAPVYPWSGVFFTDLPFHLEALARPGYAFVRWQGDGDGASLKATSLKRDTVFRAEFERLQPAFPLAQKPEYRFERWSDKSPSGSYPAYMRFEQTSTPLAASQLEWLAEDGWSGHYNLKDRSRFVGLDDDGVGLKDTGRAADFRGSGFPFAVVLALDTRGISEATIEWTCASPGSKERISKLSLELAIEEGPYQPLRDSFGKAVEYNTSTHSSEPTRFPPVRIPSEALNRSYVELRWRYGTVGDSGGSGALIRLDDIRVKGIPVKEFNNITRIQRNSSDEIVITFSGPPATEHVFQWSEDLGHWQPGETFSTSPQGRATIRINHPKEGFRFYRIARAN